MKRIARSLVALVCIAEIAFVIIAGIWWHDGIEIFLWQLNAVMFVLIGMGVLAVIALLVHWAWTGHGFWWEPYDDTAVWADELERDR